MYEWKVPQSGFSPGEETAELPIEEGEDQSLPSPDNLVLPPCKHRAKHPFVKSCRETHSSSPRKDVSVHGTTRLTRPSDGGGFLGAKAWKRRQARGVEAGSELTDVRSVLQSYEVQEESEDGDGLLASSPSRSPSLSSIVPGTEAQWGGGEIKEGSRLHQECLLAGTKALPSRETVHLCPNTATEDTENPSPATLGATPMHGKRKPTEGANQGENCGAKKWQDQGARRGWTALSAAHIRLHPIYPRLPKGQLNLAVSGPRRRGMRREAVASASQTIASGDAGPSRVTAKSRWAEGNPIQMGLRLTAKMPLGDNYREARLVWESTYRRL